MPFFHNFTAFAVFAGIAVILSACVSQSSAIIVGKIRPAIASTQVKIYLHAPKKYEDVAALESSSETSLSFTAQNKMDVVVQRLKEEAAKLGANGVILQDWRNEYRRSGSTGMKNTGISGSTTFDSSDGTTHKAATGVAIFVEDE